MSRNEQRRRTREALLEAAALEFESYGYAETTLQHVADRLGLSRGTVLFHFQSKDALRCSLIDWADTAIAQALKSYGDEEQFESTLLSVSTLCVRDPRVRSGLLLREELERAGTIAPPGWRIQLSSLMSEHLMSQNLTSSEPIHQETMTLMFLSIMNSRRWHDEKQTQIAVKFFTRLS
ncbi:MAG: helix-turn-helix domain-containing protein [Bifidobacterium psychraerophilum]|uniref:TetR/AcrR family transcriptional regulator n=1 Tax=Bifidobacterium psychraerophilum TaxID=218140 RepID=UPI0039E8FDC0